MLKNTKQKNQRNRGTKKWEGIKGKQIAGWQDKFNGINNFIQCKCTEQIIRGYEENSEKLTTCQFQTLEISLEVQRKDSYDFYYQTI